MSSRDVILEGDAFSESDKSRVLLVVVLDDRFHCLLHTSPYFITLPKTFTYKVGDYMFPLLFNGVRYEGNIYE